MLSQQEHGMGYLKFTVMGAALVFTSTPHAQAQIAMPTDLTVSSRVRLDSNAGLSNSRIGSENLFAGGQIISPSIVTLINSQPPDLVGSNYGMSSLVFYENNLSEDFGNFRFEHSAEILCMNVECGNGTNPFPGGTVNFSDSWSYSFTASQNSNFRFNYSLGVPSTTQYAGEFRDPFFVMLFGQASCIACDGATSGSGFFDYALLAGQNYTFNLRTFSFRRYDEGQLQDFRLADDLYSYQITPAVGAGIPEPASWAMIITGFGLVGSAMRRRIRKISYA
jgi:hypothetical protein